MELTIETIKTIYINVDMIIKEIQKGMSLEEAVEDYVCSLDDYYYYDIGVEEKEKIKKYVIKNM